MNCERIFVGQSWKHLENDIKGPQNEPQPEHMVVQDLILLFDTTHLDIRGIEMVVENDVFSSMCVRVVCVCESMCVCVYVSCVCLRVMNMLFLTKRKKIILKQVLRWAISAHGNNFYDGRTYEVNCRGCIAPKNMWYSPPKNLTAVPCREKPQRMKN